MVEGVDILFGSSGFIRNIKLGVKLGSTEKQ